jgi:hypothetical protein
MIQRSEQILAQYVPMNINTLASKPADVRRTNMRNSGTITRDEGHNTEPTGWTPYKEGDPARGPDQKQATGMATGVEGKPDGEKTNPAHEKLPPTVGNVEHSFDVAMTTDQIKAWRANK